MTPLMIQNKWTGLEAPVFIPVVSFLNILPQCCLSLPKAKQKKPYKRLEEVEKFSKG